MAKEGKKLELYEILAAKRAKGKAPLAIEPKSHQPEETEPPPPPPVPDRRPSARSEETGEEPERMIIVDDALDQSVVDEGYPSYAPPRAERQRASPPSGKAGKAAQQQRPPPAPAPEPRPRTPREVVFRLDTAFIMFIIVLALVGSSYFLGHKRGQEERPAGLVGLGDTETADPDTVNLRHLSPPARTMIRPPEQDYTLVLRTEAASENLPERLEYELAEAMAKGSKAAGTDVLGFIFRNTKGNDTRYVLAVGLGKTPNDPELNRLLPIYNQMELSLSREPRPYIGCQIAPVRELGTPVD